MKNLPNEILILIFSNLSEKSLVFLFYLKNAACLVSKHFNKIISNDFMWKLSLSVFYKNIPLLRIDKTSWKNEYLKRNSILYNFNKKKQILSTDLKISQIDSIDFNNKNHVFVTCLNSGTTQNFNFESGKVDRDLISSSVSQFEQITAFHHFSNYSIMAAFVDTTFLSKAILDDSMV